MYVDVYKKIVHGFRFSKFNSCVECGLILCTYGTGRVCVCVCISVCVRILPSQFRFPNVFFSI